MLNPHHKDTSYKEAAEFSKNYLPKACNDMMESGGCHAGVVLTLHTHLGTGEVSNGGAMLGDELSLFYILSYARNKLLKKHPEFELLDFDSINPINAFEIEKEERA